MSSVDRSSSAVRNLRSIFENKSSDNSPDTRGRSTSGLTSEKENSRPTSRIRASFVSVEPSGGMASEAKEGGVGEGMPEPRRASSAGLRRGSFSVSNGDDEGLLELKKTVSEEAERREKDSKVAEAIPETVAESAVNTPLANPTSEDRQEEVEESPLADKESKIDKEPANPDKPTMGAEEEPNDMKPTEPTNEAAVSGGEALPPIAEDLRPREDMRAISKEPATDGDAAPATKQLEAAVKEAKKSPSKATPNGKPTSISTKSPAKASSSSAKSPASQPKTPLSGKAPSSSKAESPKAAAQKLPAKKASRSSLTAPTAASVARAAGADRSVSSSSKQSPPSKAKREGTKPIDLPSRLTAPTAASRAKHEPASTTSNSHTLNGRSSTTSRPKQQSSIARPTPRSSLGHPHRPESRTSQATKKPSPADGSFLERMTRPTAASANKSHDKPEIKSPPRKTASSTQAKQSKVNGHAKKPAPSKTSSRPGTAKSDKPASSQPAEEPLPIEEHAEASDEPAKADSGSATETAGNETPIPQTNGHSEPADGALEATPAFAGEEIR